MEDTRRAPAGKRAALVMREGTVVFLPVTGQKIHKARASPFPNTQEHGNVTMELGYLVPTNMQDTVLKV
jgi:hypothetical protein